jgi:ribosomal protein L37AE/L43A
MISMYKPKCPECKNRSLIFRDVDNVYKCEVCGVVVDLDKMSNYDIVPSWVRV